MGLGKKNFVSLRSNKDVEKVRNGDCPPYVYTTAQFLLASKRLYSLHPNNFDLAVFDEGHKFFGPQLRKVGEHFNGVLLWKTATPFNNTYQLEDFAPCLCGSVTSDELIENYGFPYWVLHRYSVEETALFDFVEEHIGMLIFLSFVSIPMRSNIINICVLIRVFCGVW